MSVKPTDEQQQAVDQFTAGHSVKLSAYAGTGKTKTLSLIAESAKGRGLFLAFNRSIAAEAKAKFPSSVECKTTHGVAFSAIPARYSSDKKTGKINAFTIAGALDLKRIQIGRKTLEPAAQAQMIYGMLLRFLHSDDDDLQPHHLEVRGVLRLASDEGLKQAQELALGNARIIWAKMTDSSDRLPLGHDGYPKMHALGRPTLAADYILLDEAQDTNPVVIGLLRRQPARIVPAGDRYQQINEWRGAVNAMDMIETKATCYLTQSFRFGPAIAELASRLLLSKLGESRPITGNPKVESRIGDGAYPDAILARTNAMTIKAVIDALNARKRPHLAGGAGELTRLIQGVADLKRGRPSGVPEFFGFNNWKEVVEFTEDDAGTRLRAFVKFIEDYNDEARLIRALDHTVEEKDSNVTISTAHKAKGREWGSVKLMEDFVRADSGPKPDPAEMRLLYVAITRAKERLDVPAAVLSFINTQEA